MASAAGGAAGGTEEQEENVELLQLGKAFDNDNEVQALSNGELYQILTSISTTREENGRDTNPVFSKTLEYCKTFKQFDTIEACKQVRENLASKGLAEFEVAGLMNLCPDTVEEAKMLMPSLDKVPRQENAQLTDDVVEGVLADLTSYRTV